MKIAFFTIGGQVLGPIESKLREKGIEIVTNECTSDCDFMYLSTVTCTNKALDQINSNKNIPLVVYNWDQYKNHATVQKGYPWDTFNELQKRSVEIWTPSEAVNHRVEEFIGLKNKCHIIKSWARYFDYPINRIKDNRYVIQVVRNYKWDPQFEWTKRACTELNIPYHYNAKHQRSEEDFQRWIAEASVLICEYEEASTGGLTLLEGHRLGKPVLVSDSKYMGAVDYFGERATYFENGNYNDFKAKLKELYDNPPTYNLQDCIDFTNQYTLDVMVDNMIERFLYLKNK